MVLRTSVVALLASLLFLVDPGLLGAQRVDVDPRRWPRLADAMTNLAADLHHDACRHVQVMHEAEADGRVRRKRAAR